TNGVHRVTWTDPEIAKLPLVEGPEVGDREALWRIHERLKVRLIESARERLVAAGKERHRPNEEIDEASRALDPAPVIIGVDKRITTYKRPGLMFHDPARLAKILGSRPVQVIFAGKAHPHDDPGKHTLQDVFSFTRSPEFRGKIVLLPDYDMK